MKKRSTPFTLIELLVVVAIISILASMLLPALTNARNKARAITCTNQLKQIGLASVMYSDDNDEFIPFSYVDGGNFSGYADSSTAAWYVYVAPYMGIPNYSFYQLGAAYPGLSGPVGLCCPSILEQIDDLRWPVSYAPGIRVTDGKVGISGVQQKKFTQVVGASSKAFVNESDVPNNKVINEGRILVGGWHHAPFIRHSNGGNILFMDMHVDRVGFNDVVAIPSTRDMFFPYLP